MNSGISQTVSGNINLLLNVVGMMTKTGSKIRVNSKGSDNRRTNALGQG
jgi:hypothetical protein